MKKLFLVASAIFLLGVTVGRIGIFRSSSLPAVSRVLQEALMAQPASKENLREIAVVKRVIDGDTIELDTGDRVRYIGMDAPETVDPRKPVQCFGAEASKRNRELVLGKTVILQKDVSELDKYGRLLRYVWTGSKMINLELVEEGYATAFTYPPDVKYSKDFVEAERKARESKIGLWKSCK